MPNQLDVANLALGFINTEYINSINDDTPTASAVMHSWDSCFNALLQESEWSFAKRSVIPAKMTATPATWAHAFSLPEDFIRMVNVVRPRRMRVFGSMEPLRPGVDYEIQRVEAERHPAICTDIDDIAVEYISNRTLVEDFSPKAIEALAAKLAWKLSLILKHDSGWAEKMMQLYIYSLQDAVGADAVSRSPRFNDVNGYNDAREFITAWSMNVRS